MQLFATVAVCRPLYDGVDLRQAQQCYDGRAKTDASVSDLVPQPAHSFRQDGRRALRLLALQRPPQSLLVCVAERLCLRFGKFTNRPIGAITHSLALLVT